MKVRQYRALKDLLEKEGYGWEFERWQNKKACRNSAQFFRQYCWVVVAGGMRNQVVKQIVPRIHDAIKRGRPVRSVFGHRGKARAIQKAYKNRRELFRGYREASDKLAYLESLPFIGRITKYHLARNLGLDYAKPDVHLVRIAESYGTDPHKLCSRLSEVTGDRIGAVDVVLWRAANLGLIQELKQAVPRSTTGCSE